jgi:hypothetical protein
MKRKCCTDALDLPDVISPACDDFETLPRTICELSSLLNLDLIKDVRSIICGYLVDVVSLQSRLCETDAAVPIFRPFLLAHAQVFRDVYDVSGECTTWISRQMLFDYSSCMWNLTSCMCLQM